jgi:hypothetical protein
VLEELADEVAGVLRPPLHLKNGGGASATDLMAARGHGLGR